MQHTLLDEQGFKEEINSINSLKDQLQNLINLYNSLEAKPLVKYDFWSLVFDTESFFYNAILKKIKSSSSFAGIPLRREEVFKIILKPAEYNTLLSESKRLIETIEQKKAMPGKNIFRIHTTPQILKFFDLDDQGALVIKQGVIDEARKLYEKNEPIF